MTKTIGLSPKLVVAVLTAVLGYLVGQTVLELPPGVVLALQVALVAVGVYSAAPGETATDYDADDIAQATRDVA